MYTSKIIIFANITSIIYLLVIYNLVHERWQEVQLVFTRDLRVNLVKIGATEAIEAVNDAYIKGGCLHYIIFFGGGGGAKISSLLVRHSNHFKILGSKLIIYIYLINFLKTNIEFESKLLGSAEPAPDIFAPPLLLS